MSNGTKIDSLACCQVAASLLVSFWAFNATDSLRRCSSPTRTSKILDFLSAAAEMASLACDHLGLNMKNPTPEILRHRSGTCSLLNYDDS